MSVNVFRLTSVSVILAIDKEFFENVRFCFPSPECLYWDPLKPSALQQVFFSRLLLKLLDTVVALWSYKSFDQEENTADLSPRITSAWPLSVVRHLRVGTCIHQPLTGLTGFRHL